MNLNAYFDLVMQSMRKHAIYSEPRSARVISRVRAQLILLDHMDQLDSPRASPPELLEEGARRELWEMDIEAERKMPVLVMK
ncbi:hypothetical protein [Dyella monticola]|uniref:hypothetical protein n=1 Tax=Dyella monticola TaxID=1927958 RepID=UPI0011C06355|nr:hypothetical protein [Dyella monticola]